MLAQLSLGPATGFAAAIFCTVLALGVILRRRSAAAWFFAGGMAVFAASTAAGGMSLRAASMEEAVAWHARFLLITSLAPVLWLAFSLAYVRGDYQRHLARWRYGLLVVLVVPGGLAFA